MPAIYLLLLRGAGWFYYLAPRRLRAILARALGFISRMAGYRAAVVQQNLAFAYPGDSPEQVHLRAKLTRDFYRHLGHLAFEGLTLFGPMRRYAAEQGECIGAEHWERARAAGRGVLLVTSHVGSWEVAAAMGAMTRDADVVLVSRNYKPYWMRQAIEDGRKRCGLDSTYEPRTLRDVLARLKRNGTVAIVIDQYMAPPVGVRVPFFGVPVGTQVAIAVLAKRTGAAVLPFRNHRGDDGRVIVEAGAALPWISHQNPDVELALNTAAYSALVEGQIREHPAQWLWSHRRFKGDISPLRPGEWEEGRQKRGS